MNSLDRIKNALLAVTSDVYHFKALKKTDRYIVWAEDGAGNQLNANNTRRQSVTTGRIHLFSKTENDNYKGDIEDVLTESKISFILDSVSYEDDTGYIHHVWNFEVEDES